EQSGHVIFLDAGQTTGDGLLTAVELLNVMLRTGRPLSELAAVVERVPQKLVNVAARQGAVLLERPAVRHALAAAQERLGNEGRIVVRPSGTEPVVRVMVEAVDADLLEKTLSDVVEALRREQERSDTNALDA
ncbi:MAG TPA: phosphoglucosamine mutase, partial [Bacillota bacterium]